MGSWCKKSQKALMALRLVSKVAYRSSMSCEEATATTSMQATGSTGSKTSHLPWAHGKLYQALNVLYWA